MVTLTAKILSILLAFSSFTPFLVSARDDCADLFFTPAWQPCLQRKFKSNWVFNPLEDQVDDDLDDDGQPDVDFPNMPNVNDIIDQAKAQAGHPGSESSVSSSSFASTSGGVSKSVISSNGRTWTVESNGLSISTSDNGSIRHITVGIGEPQSLTNTIGDDNSLQVNLTYGDGTSRWVKVKLDSPTHAKDLKIQRANGILNIEGQV